MSDVGRHCEWAREHFDDDLTGRDARELEAHLESCDGCRSDRARRESVAHVLRELPRASAPPDLFGRIQAEIDRRETAPRPFRLLRRVAPFAAAAVAATVVALVMLHRPKPGLVIVPDSSYCQTVEDYQVRDRLFADNPFFGDVDPADAYYRILKEGWK